jgi:hypothetical protein
MALKINTTTVVDNSSNWTGNTIGTSKIADSSITRAKMGFGQISANSKANTTTVSGGWDTIQSVTITTTGKPVLICGCGDMNPTGGAGWGFTSIWRDGTQISKQHLTEGIADSQNQNIFCTFLDTPAAGTYTYNLRFINQAGGSKEFGESTTEANPTIFAVELI